MIFDEFFYLLSYWRYTPIAHKFSQIKDTYTIMHQIMSQFCQQTVTNRIRLAKSFGRKQVAIYSNLSRQELPHKRCDGSSGHHMPLAFEEVVFCTGEDFAVAFRVGNRDDFVVCAVDDADRSPVG